MKMLDIEHLFQVCDSSLAAVGYELVDLEYLREPSSWVLRIYIDHPLASAPVSEGASEAESDPSVPAPVQPSRISLQDCEQASRHLGTVLDVEDLISVAYRLEVSSPGIPRPVRKERDFKRFRGHRVRVTMQGPIAGRKNFTGIIRNVEGGDLLLDVDGQPVHLPLGQLKKARLEVEL